MDPRIWEMLRQKISSGAAQAVLGFAKDILESSNCAMQHWQQAQLAASETDTSVTIPEPPTSLLLAFVRGWQRDWEAGLDAEKPKEALHSGQELAAPTVAPTYGMVLPLVIDEMLLVIRSQDEEDARVVGTQDVEVQMAYQRYRADLLAMLLSKLLAYGERLEQLHYAAHVRWLRAVILAEHDPEAAVTVPCPPEPVSLRFLPALKACATECFRLVRSAGPPTPW